MLMKEPFWNSLSVSDTSDVSDWHIVIHIEKERDGECITQCSAVLQLLACFMTFSVKYETHIYKYKKLVHSYTVYQYS